MRHLAVSLPASMHRFLPLLCIFGLGQCIYAASIFQFPDLTRRLPERTTSPGCAYKGERYDHGERVPTSEPCLNCTCSRAVLVCYLRVCPTASAPPPGCFAAREVGECCPTLVCGGADLSRPINNPDTSLDLRPTFQPEKDETTLGDSSTEEYQADTSDSIYDTSTGTNQSAYVSEDGTSTNDGSSSDDTQAYVTSSTDALSTVNDNQFHTTLTKDDSLVFITSTQEPTHDYDINFFNDIPGGCMVNGTLYGDGSAMLSSTFCEYCFCIRGKSTCLKPKCHLTIDGCIPHYDNHYSCCPSRYDCSQKTSTTENSMSAETTILTSSTHSQTTENIDPGDCLVDGTVYPQGEVVPDRQPCHNCYCSNSSVKCEKIKCSPPLEGCQPIIPDGHCCPISYRCDYQEGHSASNSIKGANLNDSTISLDNKGTDIKSVKNYFNSNTGEVRVKSTNDRESVTLLHNVIPVHRRLDENIVQEQNSTVINVGEEASVHIRPVRPDNDISEISDHIRENDKTLNLELNDTTKVESFPAEERSFDDFEIQDHALKAQEAFSTDIVSIGSPETHTLSIQELFDQFFSKQINSSKLPDDNSLLEPKRNNSKQPSVEIFDSETDIPSSETTVIKLTTMPEIRNDEPNTETENAETGLYTSNFGGLINTTDLAFDSSTESVTQDTSFLNQEKSESKDITSIFPSTEMHRNEDEFRSRIYTESTYPAFTNTRKNGNEEFQNEFTHSTLPSFQTSEELNSEDPLETSPSELLTTISDLLNLKFNTQSDVHSAYPFSNTRVVHSEAPKQTHFTSPAYTTTKDALIEGLKLQTESRPVVFIYDTTRNSYSEEPKTRTQVPTTLLYDPSKHSFNDESVYTETNPTAFWFGSTKQLYGDDEIKQTNMQPASPIYTNEENLFNELRKQSEYFSTSRGYTSTKNLNTDDQTETPVVSNPFSTISDINNDDQKNTNSPSVYFSSTKNVNNDHQTETRLYPIHSSTISEYDKDSKTETPAAFSTHILSENTNEEGLKVQNDFLTSPIFTTIQSAENENFSKDSNIAQIHQISPVFISKIHQNTGKHQEKTNTNPTTNTLITKLSDENDLTEELETITAFLTTKMNEENHHTTASLPLVETKDQDNPIPTESTKLSTRINSKLPSFNYVQKTNENSTTTQSRFPVLTDSVVNVYLSTESKPNASSNENDFTNIGSIYLGAPLSVGSTDSRKDTGNEKPKITQSGGVIFMDPQYTDIDTMTNFQIQEQTQKGITSADSQKKTSAEKLDKDSGNHERKKGPRIQDSSNAGQGYKIIPFVAEDAIRGQFGKINNTLIVQPGSTEGLPDMVSDFCFIKGRIYINGEVIGKPDPCEMCRCFYGRELCQIQRCPTPPPDCIPEKVSGFCCPRFTCGNNATSGEQISKEIEPISHAHVPEIVTSTTRRPDVIERNPATNDKQEVKYGIRVRARPTTSSPFKSTEHIAEKKILMEKTTTVKPEIRTFASKPTVATTTTTSKRPQTTRPTSSKKPEIKRTTTTTTQNPIFPDPWGLLKVSGCNIYGKFFNINDQVEILSGPCSHCICTTNGVECNDIC